MPITKVIYEHPFNLGQYAGNEKVGFEYIMEDDENEQMVLDSLKAKAMQWLDKEYPQFNEPLGYKNHRAMVEEILKPKNDNTDQEFEALKKTIEEAPTKEMALKLIEKSKFKRIPELIAMANLKK